MNRLKTIVMMKALLALAAVLPISPVFAQADQCSVKRDVPTKALDEVTWKRLNSIYEDVGEEQFDSAYDGLQKLLGRSDRNVYLQAIVYQGLAQVEWSRKNYDASLGHFEKAVELDALPNQQHFALMYQIAQLYFMKDRFDDALEALELWFCKVPEENVTSHAWVLKASINAQKKDYPETLKAIDMAIGMDEDPKESWYQLKLAAHYELEQFVDAAATLELMISRWPDKKSYWMQLTQIYYKLEQEDKALATLALAYRKDLLDHQGDITYLSGLYSNADVPYKAAEVLEKGINDGIVEPTKVHWVTVAETWYASEELERSLVAFEKAGQAATDGEIDLRRGFILIDMENWESALEALDRALSKGGFDDRRTGEAYLLRGMAKFNLGRFDAASSDWGKASRYESTKDAARQWMNHLREERLRRAP